MIGTQFLEDEWERPVAVTKAEAVTAMMDSPGWVALSEAIAAKLRADQLQLMREKPKDDDSYERRIGYWNGLGAIEVVAGAIVRHGAAVQKEMREGS